MYHQQRSPHGSGSRINIGNLGYDLVSGLTLKKTQETIAELRNQMLPHQAAALKILRQHEEDLKAQELIAATGASLAKKPAKKKKHRVTNLIQTILVVPQAQRKTNNHQNES